MNCQEFEELVHALTSGRLLNATKCAQVLAHAEGCPACLTRLENERVLVTGLRALAAEIRLKQAPVKIEDALLVAFRESKNRVSLGARISVQAHSVDGNPAIEFSGTRTGLVSRRAWLIGAAASVLLLAGVGFIYWTDRFDQRGSSQVQKLTVPHSSPPSIPLGQVTDVSQGNSAESAAVPKPKKGSPLGKALKPSVQGSVKRKLDSTGEEETGLREIDTNFLPVMAASPLEPTESGHLIRLNLPRSTMGRFGYPISAERFEEPVKADILIGEDGVARAIRFVYTNGALPSPGQ